MPKLVVTHGGGSQVVVLGDEPITIGRDPENGLAIDRPDISRKHCRVERDGGAWRVVDLGSKNGTFVNGKAIATSPLSPRDTLQIGDATIILAEEETTHSPLTSSGDAFRLLLESDTENEIARALAAHGGATGRRTATRDFLKERLLKLNVVSQAISSELDLDRLLDAILDAVLVFTGFERGLLLLADEQGNLRPAIGRGLDQAKLPEEDRAFSHKVIDAAIEQRDMTIVGSGGDKAPPAFDPRGSWASLGLKVALAVPLISPLRKPAGPQKESERRRGRSPVRILGVIYLDSTRPLPPFDQADKRLLRTVAAQAAIALQNARLHQQATTDALTGLVNRGFFEQLLAEELKRARDESLPLSLLLLDIDRFKLVNDRHGHQTGDAVLRETARRVREALRRDDVAGRYGGEELVVILPGVGGDNARAVGEKLRNAVKASPMSEAELTVTTSVGVALYPDHGRDAASLIKRADQALYHAKHEGRDRVEVWRPALDRLGHRNDPLAGLVSGDAARDQRNLSALLSVIDSLRRSTKPEEVLDAALDRAIDVTRAERALLFLAGPGGLPARERRPELEATEDADTTPPGRLIPDGAPKPVPLPLESVPSVPGVDLITARARGGQALPLVGVRFSTSTLKSAIDERRALVLLDAEGGRAWKRDQISASIEDLKLKTVMCVPLVARDRALGAIYVDDKASVKEFGQADLIALEAIANQLALALAFDPLFARRGGETEVERLRAENAHLRAQLGKG